MQLTLLAGQSNALGYLNDGPVDYVVTDRVQIWTPVGFRVMAPGQNTGNTNNPNAWGPEVGYAKAWLADAANAGQTLYLGKLAFGSTFLAQTGGRDWSPDSSGELFDQATGLSVAMRGALDVSTLDAVLWFQGEQDATSQATAAAYQDNLFDFTAAVRDEWMNDPAGEIVVARISDSAALAFNHPVRVAQWYVDQVDDNLVSFKTIGMSMQADTVHLDAAGHIAAGKGFFDALSMM